MAKRKILKKRKKDQGEEGPFYKDNFEEGEKFIDPDDIADSLFMQLENIMKTIMAQAEDIEKVRTQLSIAAYKRVRKELMQTLNVDLPELISSMDVLFPEVALKVPRKHLIKASDAILAKAESKRKGIRGNKHRARRPYMVSGVVISPLKKDKTFPDAKNLETILQQGKDMFNQNRYNQ